MGKHQRIEGTSRVGTTAFTSRPDLLQSTPSLAREIPDERALARFTALASRSQVLGCILDADHDDIGDHPGPDSAGPDAASQESIDPFHDAERHKARSAVYGALDLGTNNCRLLLARPSRRGFRVVDAFSRIIRLGEGLGRSGRLSQPAIERTIEALRICASKLERNNVARRRLVATEACRVAENGPDFIARVKRELALDIEILTPETEASLAVSGCASLIDPGANYVMVFDIGGGSSEIVWLDFSRHDRRERGRPVGQSEALSSMAAWASLPVGVVSLAEKFGGRNVTPDNFDAMVDHVTQMIEPFEQRHDFRTRVTGASMHMLGTSGTVTTIAGIQLGLPRYDRNRVDGCWLDVTDVRSVTANLLAQDYNARIAEPCIGYERADLVLAGCAILEAFLRMWPCERLRVADRGLREGILAQLMSEDGVYRSGRRRHHNGQQSSER